MPEEDWERGGRRQSEEERRQEAEDDAVRASYDRYVSRALSSAEWIGRFSAMPSARDPKKKRWLLGHARIRAVNPSSAFADALARLDRGYRTDDGWILELEAPVLPCGLVHHRWCETMLSYLEQELEGEAVFVGVLLLTTPAQGR